MTDNTTGHFTRRTFFMASAALAVSAYAKPQAGPANERITAAVLGCRNRGHQVATNFLTSRQFDVAALCDCDSAMAERALGELEGRIDRKPDVVDDFRRVLDRQDIDAVIVATPDHWHAAMCTMALEAGKHVYVEKPASYNIADGRAMVMAQAAHPDRVVQVGTQQRSGQHFKDAREFIANGGLGKVGFARAWILHDRGTLEILPDSEPPETMNYDLWVGPAPFRPYNENRCHYWWHFIREYGTGEMGNWGAHWLDIVRWYLDLGVPKSATSFGVNNVHDAKEWPDTQTVLYEYSEVNVLWEQRLWTERGVHDRRNGAEFAGEKGSLIVDRGGWVFYPKDGEPQEHPASEMERAHAQNFADCIRGDATPAAPIEEGHTTATLCHMGNIATVLKRRVMLDPATETFVDDEEANGMVGRPYRKPWELPA